MKLLTIYNIHGNKEILIESNPMEYLHNHAKRFEPLYEGINDGMYFIVTHKAGRISAVVSELQVASWQKLQTELLLMLSKLHELNEANYKDSENHEALNRIRQRYFGLTKRIFEYHSTPKALVILANRFDSNHRWYTKDNVIYFKEW